LPLRHLVLLLYLYILYYHYYYYNFPQPLGARSPILYDLLFFMNNRTVPFGPLSFHIILPFIFLYSYLSGHLFPTSETFVTQYGLSGPHAISITDSIVLKRSVKISVNSKFWSVFWFRVCWCSFKYSINNYSTSYIKKFKNVTFIFTCILHFFAFLRHSLFWQFLCLSYFYGEIDKILKQFS
jgi:hypothetical protein